MRRTRISELCTLNNIEDVDEALRSMGDYDRRIEAIQADLELRINEARSEAAAMMEPLTTARKGLETQVGLYAKARVREFDKVRTRVLNFGEFGFRRSTSVHCPSSPDAVADVVRALREHKMTDCIKVTPDGISRETLRTYEASKVQAVGCQLVSKDTFFCAPKREELAEVE